MNPIHYRNATQVNESESDEDVYEATEPVYIEAKDVYSVPAAPPNSSEQLNEATKTIESTPTQLPKSDPINIPNADKRIESKTSNQWNIVFFGD